MAKEKEDNRDVFEKIGDYMAPVVGVAGFYAGRKIARKFGKMGDKNFSADPEHDLWLARQRNLEARGWRDSAKTEPTKRYRDQYKQNAKVRASQGADARNRVVANNALATVTGGSGALATHAATQERKKRRK